jgi:hypothetical protein
MGERPSVRLAVLAAVLALAAPTGPILPAGQVSDLRARHAEGQTILTWREVEPTFAGESSPVVDLRKLRREIEGKVRYRIYRAAAPIGKGKCRIRIVAGAGR